MASAGEIEVLDLRGLKCPMPALLARRRLAARDIRQIAILTDDPMAVVDIPHMCHSEGHSVIELTREECFVRFLLSASRLRKQLRCRESCQRTGGVAEEFAARAVHRRRKSRVFSHVSIPRARMNARARSKPIYR